MSQENSQPCVENDEIDLRELWTTLKKRKKLIWLVTLIITAAAVAYVLLARPIYEVKSNVQIGYMGIPRQAIVETDVLVKILNIVFNVEDKPATKEEFVSEVMSISSNKKLKDFIEIKAQGISNEVALEKNKEVVKYLQVKYEPEINQYIADIKYKIENTKRELRRIDTFEIKNIQEQIKLLKTQQIAQIDEQIKLLQDVKLKTIQSKMKFHTQKLEEYTKAINKLYKDGQSNRDATTVAIISMQMVNYQNLILSSQNKLEDLKIEKETIQTETIVRLQREKENISNETIRKLQHQIDVDMANKKIQLNEKIEKLSYNLSENVVQNSKVIGDYVIKDYPVKPKKKLIVVVAFITGLMFSVFLAFFLEFIQAGRKEE